ncbi:hypothetical protein WCP94_002234 [Bilophila wadsworthia]
MPICFEGMESGTRGPALSAGCLFERFHFKGNPFQGVL